MPHATTWLPPTQTSLWEGCGKAIGTLWSHRTLAGVAENFSFSNDDGVSTSVKSKWKCSKAEVLKERLLTASSGEKISHPVRTDPFIAAQVPSTAVCDEKLPVSETEAIACSLQGQENLLIPQSLLAVVPSSVSVTGATRL